MPKLPEDLDRAIHQVKTMMSDDNEKDIMSILKGHLIAEENFEVFFEEVLPNYNSLKKSQLRFSQKLCLYKAFVKNNKHGWLWSALDKLNKLRNNVGHHLVKKEKLDQEINEFINFVYMQNPWKALNNDDGNYGHLKNVLDIIHTHQLYILKDRNV